MSTYVAYAASLGYSTIASWPEYEVGPEAPVFPITLLCRDQWEYQRYQALSPCLHGMYVQHGNDLAKICEDLDLLARTKMLGAPLLRSQRCYVVLDGNGGRELICFCWCVISLQTSCTVLTLETYRPDAYEFFAGQERPHVMKTQDNLLDALELLLTRGGSIFETQKTNAEIQAFLDSLNAVDPPAESTEEPDLHEVPRRPVSTPLSAPPLPANASFRPCPAKAKRGARSTTSTSTATPPSTPRRDARRHRDLSSPPSMHEPVIVITDTEDEGAGSHSEQSLSYGTCCFVL